MQNNPKLAGYNPSLTPLLVDLEVLGVELCHGRD